VTATDPHLSNLARADRGQPAEQVCVCGHERGLHAHFTHSAPCDAVIGTRRQANVIRNTYCDCWEFTPPSWTWGQRLGVAVSIALWVGILAVLALGVTA
jgi:hypothetical protein